MWTLPEQNYCTLLSRFALYALPPSEHLTVAIAIMTTAKQPPDWLFALLRQMRHSIMLKKQQEFFQPIHTSTDLTRRQKSVLLCMARGMTDQAAAVELHISLDTIRYHKKRLYQQMGTDNAVTTVTRALKHGLLFLNEI